MSSPTKPAYISDSQQSKFHRAIADRLGLDQEIIEGDTFSVDFKTDGDDAKVSVNLVAHLPTDEVLALFNGAHSP
ncbi:hypothetical protein EFK50_07775 [Nocardioides marmoriginsengisoli]|uniref:Uncharacterized protein n=1 Tax=Nocardioides marmoriginsengisoli TaxID=661483 RepID=A0A3N0CL35_9ACTN|nr:hypothetical protein [Nocardioides marmoriginsengisoli]RNL63633.1 hypothetical protein EFK50_07775 [Nocardioides marmoriginsengisoli]